MVAKAVSAGGHAESPCGSPGTTRGKELDVWQGSILEGRGPFLSSALEELFSRSPLDTAAPQSPEVTSPGCDQPCQSLLWSFPLTAGIFLHRRVHSSVMGKNCPTQDG